MTASLGGRLGLVVILCWGVMACASIHDKAVTGTWSWSGQDYAGGQLRLDQQGDDVIFRLEAFRGGPSYNSGLMEGRFTLKDQQGVYEMEDYGKCRVTFRFKDEVVLVEQQGTSAACGLGMGVYTDGRYRRQSATAPDFDDERWVPQ
ncbi:hypothetical protein BFW38_02900 [Terasakiispira papahanaumokuakeensis]|uniref:Uncharacterized protein n=1 Tax=Terasakiispira papahanaumokuakeensis TaxID=197479 RepID=A0A1E2V6N7_9GAMM|nr:hypothetical protein [Terasakiispira papahanaumokuakeensis]ODC02647.1 hypothetical protein BFW38_02900 [Terasakiispira papahanaumokuakeensis]